MPTNQNRIDFLSEATHTVRELVLESFSADSCVATTRILLDVLAYFGIHARPLQVEVLVFNAEARVILDAGGIDAVAHAVQARTPEDVGGPWTLGIGVDTGRNPQGGHLVAALPEDGVILDGSLDQAARPLKDIHVTADVIEVPDREFFTSPGAMMSVTASSPGRGDVLLVYTHSPRRNLLQSPNWKRKSSKQDGAAAFRRITAESIRRLRN